jgi:hypothetical protein
MPPPAGHKQTTLDFRAARASEVPELSQLRLRWDAIKNLASAAGLRTLMLICEVPADWLIQQLSIAECGDAAVADIIDVDTFVEHEALVPNSFA